MLSIIMAGGEGERLRPLTCTLPKPMALLLDKPILSYSLELLKQHNIEKVGVTLGYLPEKIMDEFGDGSEYGVTLKYFSEPKPLGTAGGVKQASSFLTETFCVLSGDGVTDVNLTEALNFHRERGAKVTMILKRVPNPTQYGLVTLSSDSRVSAFTEKPTWSRVHSDLANTGIYILEPEVLSDIPDDRMFDFSRDLFPLLLSRGDAVFGYETDAYWCDIGDFSAYLSVQKDALDGKISLIRVPENGIFRMPGAAVDEEAVIKGPVFIGKQARIGRGAQIEAYSVIGENAVVAERASVKRSMLYPGSVICQNAQIRACVIAPRAIVGQRSTVFEECVVGEESCLAANVSLKPGAKIWPGKHIYEGACVSENLVWGQRAARAFDGEAIRAVAPADAARAGQALVWKLKPERVLVGRSASAVAASQEKAILSGIASEGAYGFDAGECTLPQLRFLIRNLRMDGGIFTEPDRITYLCSDQTTLDAGEKQRIEAALSRQDMPVAYAGITHPTASAGRGDLSYLGFLESAAVGSVRRLSAAVYAQSEPLLFLAENAFQRAGIRARVEWEEELMELEKNEIGVYLSLSGDDARFADEKGMLNEAQNELLTVWAMAENGEKRIFAPSEATRTLDSFCKSLGISVEYAIVESADWERLLKKESPYQFYMRFDGLYRALSVISFLNEKELSLSDFRARMPEVFRMSEEVEIAFPARGETLRRFQSSLPDGFEREDWFFRGKHGCAWVRASEDKPVCTVTAESRDAEFAREICDLFSGLLKSASSAEPKA